MDVRLKTVGVEPQLRGSEFSDQFLIFPACFFTKMTTTDYRYTKVDQLKSLERYCSVHTSIWDRRYLIIPISKQKKQSAD